MIDLFHKLCHYLNIQPDRRGEAHVDCPFCGKLVRRGQTHFSFSERGGYCFVCGESCGLKYLAKTVGLDNNSKYSPQEHPTKSKTRKHRRWWQDHLDETLQRLTFHSVEDRLRAWRTYHPRITREMVEEHRLGYGKLPLMFFYGSYIPASRCKHARLLVPLFDFDDTLIGVRGRAIDCDCGKWLSPSGNKFALYNWQGVEEDNLVMIVENPIDALLVTEYTDAVGVATLSVSYWKDRWADFLERMKPKVIVVAYDNHWPGQGTYLDKWREKHDQIPMPGAKRLQNRLGGRGFSVRLWKWADDDPYKCDIGQILKNSCL